MKQTAPAAERNKQPILEVLARVLPAAGGVLLEVASGTGQHAVHFARGLPAWRLQPSDTDADALTSIAAWVAEARAAGVENVEQPIHVDVCVPDWAPPGPRPDAIFCANMIHIAPWAAALGLLDGAARLLRPGGLLATYGPYIGGGRHTAPSNEAFDRSLRARDPAWGVRDLDAIVAEAAARGLALAEVVEMPANNLTVIYHRDS